MEPSIDFAEATKLLSAGATLVTASKRLARHLARRFADAQLARGITAWETADILALGAWLERGYRRLIDGGHSGLRLLSLSQQRILWQKRVGRSAEGQGLLRPDTAAALAAEAWERLCAWNLDLRDLPCGETDEVHAFCDWARGYAADCAANDWIDAARVPHFLQVAVESGRLELPATLIFAGFETLTPAVAALAAGIEGRGTRVCELIQTRTAPDATIRRLALSDPQAEIHAAAAWAVARLKENPDARLALVVPDLATRLDAVRRTFDDLLLPAGRSDLRPPAQRPYNISLGRPLAELPLIHDALLALRLAVHGLAFDALSTLLRSPFIGNGESEHLARGALDVALREQPLAHFPAHRLQWLARRSCPRLAEDLAAAVDALAGKAASPAVWSGRIRDALSAFGWPGERGLDSDEFQQAEAFRNLVDALPALTTVEPRMDAGRALACLGEETRATTFQARTPAARIQIMGLLEADGQQFDGLWISGMTDLQLPRPAEPHPLLPVALQRRHAMPHASAERELDFATRLLDRLLAAAPEVILSWPHQDEDRELLPSPLILPIAECRREDIGAAPLSILHEEWLGRQALERLDDACGLPLGAGEAGGGSWLLVDQAACPFRAYAHHRLDAAGRHRPRARALGAIPRQPDACRTRSLLERHGQPGRVAGKRHRSPRWTNRRSGGRSPDQGRRRPFRQTARPGGVAPAATSRRLARGRAPTHALQRRGDRERRRVDIAGLHLNILADRIDLLDDGTLVIIDYKTGRASRDGWFADRLFEPQLPLYALTAIDPGRDATAAVSAVSFASLRASDNRFIGTAAADGLLARGIRDSTRPPAWRPEDWPALLEHWREELDRWPARFCQGLGARPSIQKGRLRMCDLGDLCRIPRGDDAADDAPGRRWERRDMERPHG